MENIYLGRKYDGTYDLPSNHTKFTVEDFMEASINQHKDTIDRMARLEQQIAQLLRKEESNDTE